MKNNTNYFSHDCNARDDEKIMLLRAEYWWEWYGIFWLMIEKLSEATEYKLLLSNKLVISKLYQANIEVINYLFDLWLLAEQWEYMYSPSLLYRMQLKLDKKLKQSEWWKKAMLSRWKGKEESQHDKLLITSKVKQSKVKEIKEDKLIYNIQDFVDQRNSIKELRQNWKTVKWLPETRKITDRIQKARYKVSKEYTQEEIKNATNKYIEKIEKTIPNQNWDWTHRYTLFEFITRDKWLQNYINS